MRFNLNSEAALVVDMASANHCKHLSILNSHHEFVRFINPKLRVVAACLEPTAYDSQNFSFILVDQCRLNESPDVWNPRSGFVGELNENSLLIPPHVCFIHSMSTR